MNAKKYVSFSGSVLIVGCGSIGQAILPMILRHIDVPASRVQVVTADERGRKVAEALGVKFTVEPITRENCEALLQRHVVSGDFLVNLSVDVSSVALMQFCAQIGALYLDTCTEPWCGGYSDEGSTLADRSNYAQREQALGLRRNLPSNGPTSVITHGANPGLVSHFVKAALLKIAEDGGKMTGRSRPTSRQDWAELARDVGVKVIHIAERDTQVSSIPKEKDEFVNTWSVDGFVSEGAWQPAELGWGSHELQLPSDGHRHTSGSLAAIYLDRPGCMTQVRTWTPKEGPFHGFLVTHSESISIADYFTLGEAACPDYRPTVHYAYHPCDAAVVSIHELAGKNFIQQSRQRLLVDEITSGMDELGVLMMGDFGTYWYGSQLTIEQARRLAPYQNATGLQVTAAVLGAMVWAIENPKEGIVEPDEIDHERVLEIATPYLGDVVGVKTNWTPLEGRSKLFAADIALDPWQFRNFRIV